FLASRGRCAELGALARIATETRGAARWLRQVLAELSEVEQGPHEVDDAMPLRSIARAERRVDDVIATILPDLRNIVDTPIEVRHIRGLLVVARCARTWGPRLMRSPVLRRMVAAYIETVFGETSDLPAHSPATGVEIVGATETNPAGRPVPGGESSFLALP